MPSSPEPSLRRLAIGDAHALLHHAERKTFLVCGNKIADTVEGRGHGPLPDAILAELGEAGVLERPDEARAAASNSTLELTLCLQDADADPAELADLLRRSARLPPGVSVHAMLPVRHVEALLDDMARYRDRIGVSIVARSGEARSLGASALMQIFEMNVGLVIELDADAPGSALAEWTELCDGVGGGAPIVFTARIGSARSLESLAARLAGDGAARALNVSLSAPRRTASWSGNEVEDLLNAAESAKRSIALLAEWELPLERLLSSHDQGLRRALVCRPLDHRQGLEILSRLEAEHAGMGAGQDDPNCRGCSIEGFCRGHFLDPESHCSRPLRTLAQSAIERQCLNWLERA